MPDVEVRFQVSVAGAVVSIRELQAAMLLLGDPRRAGRVLRALAGGESSWAMMLPDMVEGGGAWAGY